MDVKIENKDTVLKPCGDMLYIDGIDEILQRVKIACTIKRGDFPFDRQLGSFAHTVSLTDSMLCEKLEMIYKEATVDIPYTDLKVLQVQKEKNPPTATIRITCGTDSATTEVTING